MADSQDVEIRALCSYPIEKRRIAAIENGADVALDPTMEIEQNPDSSIKLGVYF